MFTGVAIDKYRGRFNMLPENLGSLVVARDELAAAEVSTPLRVSRVRGTVIHYGYAIPFVAVAAPSLSQLMHDRETGTGPVEVPALEAEKEMEFDWDQEVQVSARAREALEFMRVALERYCAVGQPLWPVVPSSLYGAFLAWEETDTLVLVITFDASVHGWGAVLRTSPDEPGVEVVGGFRLAADPLGRAFIEPSALPDSPAAQVYRETLACFPETQAASQLYPLADFTVLIRSDCMGAISALRKGSFRSPELQNVVFLHNSLFLDLRAMPPLYLHAPGAVLKAEGVDNLSRSRETARARRASESLPALRRVVMAEATRRLGSLIPISLDLFATADNTLVPRFFAHHQEPLAEGADALAQPDWGLSRCSCGLTHRECVLAFPPRGVLQEFVAKARSDGMRWVVRLWPVEPAYVCGVRAAVRRACKAQAAAVAPERTQRIASASQRRSCSLAGRAADATARGKTAATEGHLKNPSYSCAHPLRAFAPSWMA